MTETPLTPEQAARQARFDLAIQIKPHLQSLEHLQFIDALFQEWLSPPALTAGGNECPICGSTNTTCYDTQPIYDESDGLHVNQEGFFKCRDCQYGWSEIML